MTYSLIGFSAAAIYALTGYLLGRRLFHDRTKPFKEGASVLFGRKRVRQRKCSGAADGKID